MDWLKYGSRKARWLQIGMVLLGLEVGCNCDRCMTHCKHGHDVPPPPDPVGTAVHEWQTAQANKAEASDFVIFLNEWHKGGTELGPQGHNHLTHMVHRLPSVPFPVVIQPQIEPEINEKRRQVVVMALLRKGVPDADQRVIIAYPEAEGLTGDFAELAYRRMLYTGAVGNYGGAYGGYGAFGGYGLRGLGYGGFSNFGRFGLGGALPWGF